MPERNENKLTQENKNMKEKKYLNAFLHVQ